MAGVFSHCRHIVLLDATRAIITSCLEPVFAVLLAVIFIHELLRGWQAAGMIAVMAATILAQKSR